MTTKNDPDHHDVFPGGKRGVEVRTVTQEEIDAVLRRAGLPTSTDSVDNTPTTPCPPDVTFADAFGMELYVAFIDPRACLRAPRAPSAALLNQPLM